MSWVIDIDQPNDADAGNQNSRQQSLPVLGGKDQQDKDNSEEGSTDVWAADLSNVNNDEQPARTNKKITIPSAKEMREATIEGIYNRGELPEYQDYTVVLAFLIDEFFKSNFDYETVEANVPWFSNWIINPFNENLLNKELELAAKLEATRVNKRIQYMLKGGICSRTWGRCFACMCICMPCCSVLCKVFAYFMDLFLWCVWKNLFDWWLGRFVRRYVIFYICLFPRWLKARLEFLLFRGDLYEDEELSIQNIYESNSYRIANHYVCLFLLAVLLTMLGASMVITSYIYLPTHPDVTFVKFEAFMGLLMIGSGCFGLQFFCRFTL